MLGSAVTTVVLPLVVYQATGSAAKTGLLFAVRVVPYLLVGLIAGPVADRGNRRVLIIGGNLAEGALVATLPLAHLLGVLTIGQVYLVSLLSATAFVFSDAAVFGAVPALVGAERLPAANGLLASMASGAEIVGPVLAGVLVVSIGPTGALWIDALSFFIAAAVQLTIRSTFRDPSSSVSPAISISGQAAKAFRFVRGNRTIATLLVVGFGNSLGFGVVLSLLVPYAVETLGLRSDDGRIGLLYGALGVGSLFSGLLFSRVFRADRVGVITPASLGLSSACIVVLTLDSMWFPAAVLAVVFSFSITTTIMVGITYRQIVAPDELRSTVNVIGRMIAWGGQPFGAAVGAAIAATKGVPPAYAFAAGVMLTSALGAAVALQRPTAGAS